jgi:hypothetical protein
MRAWVGVAAGLALAAAAGAGYAHERQAGAHEHGRGTLNIALEGGRLSMELEAPGADIVGFEHKAKTQKQKAAIEKAEQQLMTPEALFQLPAAAGCELETAGVALEGTDHDHGHGAKGHGDKSKNAKSRHADHEHSVFKAAYTFDCKSPASLTTIGFGYFKTFAGAQKLDVTVITPKQQNRFEVSRASPRIDLAGMM